MRIALVCLAVFAGGAWLGYWMRPTGRDYKRMSSDQIITCEVAGAMLVSSPPRAPEDERIFDACRRLYCGDASSEDVQVIDAVAASTAASEAPSAAKKTK